MAKEIPIYISEKKLFAAQLTATWEAMAKNTLLGIDPATNKPKSLFDIGDLTEIVNGSMVNDVIARKTGQIKVYDSASLAVGAITWENLLSAGVSLLPKGYINGFLPEYVSGGTTLKIGGGKCRDSADSTNLDATSLGEKDLMQTWTTGFGAGVGSMIGGGAHYSEDTKMTGAALPAGEMAFATGNYSSYYPWEAFDQIASYVNTVWFQNVDPAAVTQYLGRKNNIGVIKRVMLQSVYGYSYTAGNWYNSAPENFEIVGTNDAITDQSSFNAASWTTLGTFTGEQWTAGLEKKYFEFTNTTNWGWVGIKVTKANGATAVGLNQMMFSTDAAINAIKPMTETTYVSNTNGIHTSISYHCFVLYNPIADTYDWCVDTKADGSNILNNSAIVAAGFTKFRRVFSFTGNPSTQIQEFIAHEVHGGGLKVVLLPDIYNAAASANALLQYYYQGTVGYSTGVMMNNPFVPRGIMISMKAGVFFNATTTAGTSLYAAGQFEKIYNPWIAASDTAHQSPTASTNSAGYSRYVICHDFFDTINACYKTAKGNVANAAIHTTASIFLDYRTA